MVFVACLANRRDLSPIAAPPPLATSPLRSQSVAPLVLHSRLGFWLVVFTTDNKSHVQLTWRVCVCGMSTERGARTSSSHVIISTLKTLSRKRVLVVLFTHFTQHGCYESGSDNEVQRPMQCVCRQRFRKDSTGIRFQVVSLDSCIGNSLTKTISVFHVDDT